MTTDDKDIVSALRAALVDKVGEDRYELWFGPGVQLDFDGRRLTIGVPSQFFLDWIRSNFRREIEEACFEALGTAAELTFRVKPALPGPQTDGKPGNDSSPATGRPRQAAAAFRVVGDERGNEADGGKGESNSKAANRSNGFGSRRFNSFDTYVQGCPNELAVTSARIAARDPGDLTPLLIHGPTGVGKTHLLEGIWSAARKSRRATAPIYLSAEQFTTQFLDALRGSGLPSFRRKYRGVGLLIIDDLQFLAGKRATQVELLHTIDTLLRQRHQLVFSADRHPAELAELAPELITRLESGMICRIERPDYATRLGIVAQMARRLRLCVPSDVREFIATRLTSHAREISGALCRLQATAESLGRPISLSLAEDALAEMIRNSGRPVRLGDIERAVCEVFGLESQSLHSSRKTKSVSHPRMLAMWLARKHTRAALSEIGQYFGRRSHSTVISAQKRVDDWMASGKSLETADRSWDVDEAIRRVERQLAAG